MTPWAGPSPSAAASAARAPGASALEDVRDDPERPGRGRAASARASSAAIAAARASKRRGGGDVQVLDDRPSTTATPSPRASAASNASTWPRPARRRPRTERRPRWRRRSARDGSGSCRRNPCPGPARRRRAGPRRRGRRCRRRRRRPGPRRARPAGRPRGWRPAPTGPACARRRGPCEVVGAEHEALEPRVRRAIAAAFSMPRGVSIIAQTGPAPERRAVEQRRSAPCRRPTRPSAAGSRPARPRSRGRSRPRPIPCRGR